MKAARIFLILVVIVIVAALASSLVIETVPVAMIGVKQVLWGGKGVIEKDYPTGFHVGITGVHTWHFLDARTHFLTFGSEGSGAKPGEGIHTSAGQIHPSLELRTKDNNMLNIDVTVTYRIIPGEAYKLVAEAKQTIYRDRIVQVVEKELREELAELGSDEVIVTDRRLQIVNDALPKLALAMREYHVEPEQILIRAISFPSGYEEVLQNKQLSYQKELLARSETVVQKRKAETEGLAAETVAKEKDLRGKWDRDLQAERSKNLVAIQTILAEAEIYDKETRSKANADYEVKNATGLLAVEKAEALRDQLRNEALNTAGGRILLAREAAENLDIEHVTLNSNDPRVPSILDVDALTRLLIGTSGE
jgi:regulator of protease activity HflC (stomatin/prohibitin superfamily)